MAYRTVVVFSLALAASALGCGKEIGDACQTAIDCSPNGDRQCDLPGLSLNGYCTIQGCDYSTCPGEAACIRFFTGSFANKDCDYDVANPAAPGAPKLCSLDELCSLAGKCVPRSAEVRYCMKTCDSNDDCRDDFDSSTGLGYVCRDIEKMKVYGGEPVLAPGKLADSKSPKFCAQGPR